MSDSTTKIYDRNDVFKSTLDYFNGDELATNTWINKYALKDSYGNIYELNPDDMHVRLAKEIYRIEQNYPNPLSYDLILSLIKDFKYLVPAGGSLTGIGNNFQVSSLSNCFVVGNPYDSYGSIFHTDEQQVQLMKRRGGVGHDLSHIRPKDSLVNNSALTSTGVVPFMERYSNSTREVAQSGRRGALMLSFSINHPDSEDFINAKLEDGKVTGANISVKIGNDFMQAVIDDKPYTQKYPIYSENPDTIKEVDSKRLWNKIIHNVWKSAEPGVLFWDKIIEESPADCYADEGFKTVSTNPCVVGDTLILTNKGWIKIKNLENKEVQIITKDENGKLYNSDLTWVGITNELDQIFEIKFKSGEKYRVNKTHKYYNDKFEKIEVGNLKSGDIIVTFSGFDYVEEIIETIDFEPVYDLTAVPNYNFFALLDNTIEEEIIEDKIIINDELSFYFYDVMTLENGKQKLAFELNENDKIVI